MKLGLIIMVNYNQSKEIGPFLDSMTLPNSNMEVILVDDGSNDGSDLIAEMKGFKVLRHEKNLGIGSAIRTGINFALKSKKYFYVVIMSSNGKMKYTDLPAIIEPIVSGRADYSQGTRFKKEGNSIGLSNFRRKMIPLFSIITSFILRKRFTDITCGFRAYTLDFLKNPKIQINQSWLNKYELEFYLHFWATRLKFRIEEVPVKIDYSHLEKNRKSKIKPFIGWWSMVRPFIFLSLGLKK